MYKILVVLALFSWMSCESDTTNKEKEQPTAAAAPAATPQQVAKSTPATKGGVSLTIDSKTVKPEQEFCVDVKAAQVTGLLSMQYSIQWEPSELEFLTVRGFNLPFMTLQNFGINSTKQGVLTSAWFDNNLQGINIEDDRKFYEICFKAQAKSGTKATIRFWDQPTPYEFSVAPENIVNFTPNKGEVTIQ